MVEKSEQGERKPNQIDLHVGSRMRLRRKLLSISQEKLADALGLTFQQVQKYERGANRISASKLFEAARFLKAPVTYFYEGLGRPDDVDGDGAAPADASTPAVYSLLADQDGAELATAFLLISDRRRRKVLVDVAREFAAERTAAT